MNRNVKSILNGCETKPLIPGTKEWTAYGRRGLLDVAKAILANYQKHRDKKQP